MLLLEIGDLFQGNELFLPKHAQKGKDGLGMVVNQERQDCFISYFHSFYVLHSIQNGKSREVL